MSKILVIAMGSLVAIGVLCGFALTGAEKKEFLVRPEMLVEAEFRQFLEQYGKVYSESEYDKRLLIFQETYSKILAFNSLGETWMMGCNQFSDLTNSEFRALYLIDSGFGSESSETLEFDRNTLTAPSSVDWRSAGAVTPVGNQGFCKAGWAFSAAGALEGAWFISKGSLIALSEQQLIDCSIRYGNNGCTAGTMDYAFAYITANGLTSDSNYPYTSVQSTCKSGIVSVATISSSTDVMPSSPQALYAAVTQQPISVAVDADPTIWQYYGGGVVSRNCGTFLNHAAVVVGYNSTSNPPYWILKNSFGVNWGESGYIRLAVVSGNGVCGVQMQPSYPVI